MKAAPCRPLVGSLCLKFCKSYNRAFSEARSVGSGDQQPKYLDRGLLHLTENVETLNRDRPRQRRAKAAEGAQNQYDGEKLLEARRDVYDGSKEPKEVGQLGRRGLNRRRIANSDSKTLMRARETSTIDNTTGTSLDGQILATERTHNSNARRKNQKVHDELWREEFKPYGKPLSDHICARLFATKAFSPSTIIKGLEMLSMAEIGPLALRQLATREQSALGTAIRLGQLRDAGILIDQSRMSKLIQRLADDGKEAAMLEMLGSDLHPDAVEDLNVLERLLVSQHANGAWTDFRNTLVMLTALDSDPRRAVLKILLKHNLLSTQSFQDSLQQVEELRSARLQVPSQLFITLLQQAWDEEARYQQTGQRKDPNGLAPNSLSLAVESLLQSLYSGQEITPALWRTTLFYLGNCGRLDEMAVLTTKLMGWFCKTDETSPKIRPLSSFVPIQFLNIFDSSTLDSSSLNPSIETLQIIFNGSLLADIIRKPFLQYFLRPSSAPLAIYQNNSRGDDENIQPWASGIILVRSLRDCGVEVTDELAQDACLDVLYSIYSSDDGQMLSKRNNFIEQFKISDKQIRRARINNRLPSEKMVASINRAWGRALFEPSSSFVRSLQPPKPLIRLV